jgi:hypothetical protein
MILFSKFAIDEILFTQLAVKLFIDIRILRHLNSKLFSLNIDSTKKKAQHVITDMKGFKLFRLSSR